MDISTVRVIDHPLMHVYISQLRDMAASPAEVRRLLRLIGCLLFPELTRELPILARPATNRPGEDEWHLTNGVSVIGIMRTGLVLLDQFLELFPEAQAIHLGIRPARDGMGVLPYYEAIPQNFANREVIIVDAAISSGNTLLYALEAISAYSPASITVGVIVADPAGISRIQNRYPEVRFVVAATDSRPEQRPLLPQNRFGVFADRVYGTA